MAAEHLPFDLISRPPADPAAHRAQDKQALLARRQLPHFLASHQQAALRYQPSNDLLLGGCPRISASGSLTPGFAY